MKATEELKLQLSPCTVPMDISDDDLFLPSDEEETVIKSSSSIINPVEEHLLEQMHDTTERIEKARCNVDRVKALTEKIIKKLNVRETCGECIDSDTDSELYQVTGEPVIKKKRSQEKEPSQILEIKDVWQRIINDKWIMGIGLKNTSSRTLKNLRAYIMMKDEAEIRGCSSFWEITDSMATRTEELASEEVDKTIATIVLDIPNFAEKNCFEAFGTILYSMGENNLQTPIPTFRLTADNVKDKTFAPKFSFGAENTVLALKSICVEREIIIPIDKEGIGARLDEFLDDNGFNSIGDEMPDVYVAKANDFYRHCIFEILAINGTDAPVRISARSPSQLEVIVRLLREKFSDVDIEDMEDRTMKAARALEHELELELVGDCSRALQMARFTTDLLIP
ncbi:uncharacterized protein [Venturia canescens]|uniref:uncharacterized protein isoform X2 n=1 Tax=Venturia canescens TaxID=32260 RepID=UPI001C9C0E7E|nr:uncharacterized protein LOC122415816 isoform X2 [Venturia canescens]